VSGNIPPVMSMLQPGSQGSAPGDKRRPNPTNAMLDAVVYKHGGSPVNSPAVLLEKLVTGLFKVDVGPQLRGIERLSSEWIIVLTAEMLRNGSSLVRLARFCLLGNVSSRGHVAKAHCRLTMTGSCMKPKLMSSIAQSGTLRRCSWAALDFSKTSRIVSIFRTHSSSIC